MSDQSLHHGGAARGAVQRAAPHQRGKKSSFLQGVNEGGGEPEPPPPAPARLANGCLHSRSGGGGDDGGGEGKGPVLVQAQLKNGPWQISQGSWGFPLLWAINLFALFIWVSLGLLYLWTLVFPGGMALRWCLRGLALGGATGVSSSRLHLQQSTNTALFSVRSLPQALQWWRSRADVPLPPPSSPLPLIHVPPPDENKHRGSTEGDPPTSSALSSSVDEVEVSKFAAIADTWWDSDGPFKPLHSMNPTRLSFIRSTLCRHFGRDPNCARPLEGLRIVDVGCGGGILSEPLARMGAAVTGIDAVEKNIKIASLHAGLDPLTSSIEYRCATAEKMVEEQRTFDAVISLEVIEHVADPAGFCKSLGDLAVPGGAVAISTVNRSIRAYAVTIVAAEYILGWLPRGTHQWSSFFTPEELVLIMQRASISVQEMAGLVYNPLTGEWSLSDDTSVNYIACGIKRSP